MGIGQLIRASIALCVFGVSATLIAAQTVNAPRADLPRPSADSVPSQANSLPPNAVARAAVHTPAAATKRVVLLLPSDQTLLRRASLAVRDGVRAVAAKSGNTIELRDCAYGDNGVVQAYQRCVTENIDAVIGPVGRNEVAALVNAKLPIVKPTLMLSPTGATPPKEFYVLAPDLESEAEAIARQSLEDACRKPMLIEMSGQIFSRIAVAIVSYYKSGGVSTPLQQVQLGARERWAKLGDDARRDGIDCVLFAGNGAVIYELRPYLRNITIYVTSSSHEAELDRFVDWTGVRIADSPFLLEPQRTEFASVAAADASSPTLARLYALGIDAARIAFTAFNDVDPNSDAALLALRDPREGKRNADAMLTFKPTESFDGAIGKLQLRDGQYLRVPMIGEFRGRAASALGR
jgi:uncharacterized protein